MLPMVMGPHTVGKVSQPSFSIKGRSKLGSFSDDLHKARVAQLGQSMANPPAPERWPIWPLPPEPRTHQPDPHPPEGQQLFIPWEPHVWPHPTPTGLHSSRGEGQTRDQEAAAQA